MGVARLREVMPHKNNSKSLVCARSPPSLPGSPTFPPYLHLTSIRVLYTLVPYLCMHPQSRSARQKGTKGSYALISAFISAAICKLSFMWTEKLPGSGAESVAACTSSRPAETTVVLTLSTHS